MRIVVSEDSVEVRLARWQKVLGLMRDIRVARSQVSDVEVVQQPVRLAMRTGIKVGLRLPWLLYVARTIGLDQVFIVIRGVPALAFSVLGEGPLRRVTLSTRDAEQLAARIREG